MQRRYTNARCWARLTRLAAVSGTRVPLREGAHYLEVVRLLTEAVLCLWALPAARTSRHLVTERIRNLVLCDAPQNEAAHLRVATTKSNAQ